MYFYSGTQAEGMILLMVMAEAQKTCVFRVSALISSINIPLTKANHVIEFKGYEGKLIPWTLEKVDIFEV